MGERRISVESVTQNPEKVDILVVVWEKQMVEGVEKEVVIGEKALTFPGGTEAKDMLPAIEEAGEQVQEAASQAKKIRTDLNQLLQEEIKQ